MEFLTLPSVYPPTSPSSVINTIDTLKAEAYVRIDHFTSVTASQEVLRNKRYTSFRWCFIAGNMTVPSLLVHADEAMVVKPAIPTEESTVFLHNIDQQVFLHVEVLFMYDVRSPTGDVVDNVRRALSEALVPYYFAAGRFRVNEQEQRLELVCNGAGALFTGAYCDTTIVELGDLRVPNPDFRKLLLYPTNVKTIEDIPMFTIQVTRFKCGGFIVGIYTSHVVFDGISGFQFFNDIGRIARGEKISAKNITPDRTVLRSRSPPRISFNHRELLQLPDIPARLLFNPASYNISAPPKHAFKTFTFTLHDQAVLKKRALEDGSLQRCSAFEALTAHLWRARTKALGMDPSSISKLFIAMNIRDKINFPAGFTGNGVLAAPCVNTTADSLSEKPFSFCVRKVQETIAMSSEEYIRSHIDWCEVNGHGIIDLPGGMIITPWSKLGFENVDFGWGRPSYTAPPVNDRPEYVLVLSSCKGDGAVDVFMAMEFHLMTKLEACLEI